MLVSEVSALLLLNMSNNYSNLNRNDANEGEESFNDEQQEAAEGGAAPPVPTANPMHLLSLASNFAAQGQTNPTTQQSELFRQLQTFLQQGGQNAPAPAIQQPQSPATQLQGSTQTMPIQQQPPAAAPPPSQDAVPMLVNAMLRGGQFPSTASTSNVELNQTLILAMTQLVQYRNLAQFLMQLLSQMIGPLPVQMLVASMGVLASPLSPATSPNTNPQQLPAEGIPALATLSQQIAQHLSQQNEAGSDSNEAQAILSQFQNFLQRMAAGNVSTSGSESGFQLPNPAMAFFSSTTPSTGNNASEASGMESANSRRNPNLSSPDTNRDRPAAAATEPPIPLPVRKKRKYDHEAFPEKVRTQ